MKKQFKLISFLILAISFFMCQFLIGGSLAERYKQYKATGVIPQSKTSDVSLVGGPAQIGAKDVGAKQAALPTPQQKNSTSLMRTPTQPKPVGTQGALTPQEAQDILKFFSTLPNTLKTSFNDLLKSLDYDRSDTVTFVFPMQIGAKRIDYGFIWRFGFAGSGDFEKAFDSVKTEVLSPTVGESGILRLLGKGEYAMFPQNAPIRRVKLLDLILGQAILPPGGEGALTLFLKPVKFILAPISNITTVLTPDVVFLFKSLMMVSSYIRKNRVEDIQTELTLLLNKLKKTVNVQATIDANNGEQDSSKWKTKIYYLGESEVAYDKFARLIEKVPAFIRDTLYSIQMDVLTLEYQKWQAHIQGREFDASQINPEERTSLTLPVYLDFMLYYFASVLDTKFYGDVGYEYDESPLSGEAALKQIFAILFRVYVDMQKAMLLIQNQEPDITLISVSGQPVTVGKKAFLAFVAKELADSNAANVEKEKSFANYNTAFAANKPQAELDSLRNIFMDSTKKAAAAYSRYKIKRDAFNKKHYNPVLMSYAFERAPNLNENVIIERLEQKIAELSGQPIQRGLSKEALLEKIQELEKEGKVVDEQFKDDVDALTKETENEFLQREMTFLAIRSGEQFNAQKNNAQSLATKLMPEAELSAERLTNLVQEGQKADVTQEIKQESGAEKETQKIKQQASQQVAKKDVAKQEKPKTAKAKKGKKGKRRKGAPVKEIKEPQKSVQAPSVPDDSLLVPNRPAPKPPVSNKSVAKVAQPPTLPDRPSAKENQLTAEMKKLDELSKDPIKSKNSLDMLTQKLQIANLAAEVAQEKIDKYRVNSEQKRNELMKGYEKLMPEEKENVQNELNKLDEEEANLAGVLNLKIGEIRRLSGEINQKKIEQQVISRAEKEAY